MIVYSPEQDYYIYVVRRGFGLADVEYHGERRV